MTDLPDTARRLTTEIRSDGTLALRLASTPLPAPAPGEVLVRIEAAPLHPTDLGQLLLAGDLTRAAPEGDALIVPIHEAARPMLAARAGMVLPIGSEGAGTVIAVGDEADRALVGRLVGTRFGSGMYATHRVLPRDQVIPLPDGIDARAGAALTVNPLTALAMVETMRHDGAEAMVHTAAASSLGQMLQRICARDGIPLVAIVRSAEQAALLREAGGRHVLDSTGADFMAQLIAALVETNATIAFDAVGGGPLAGTILTAMEQAQQRRSGGATFYGSSVAKKVYVYGRLDPSPSLVPPTVGMAWTLAGFLLPHFLEAAGPAVRERMVARVLDELTTTFHVHYTDEVPLDALLDPAVLARANAKATRAKLLVRPNA